MRTRKKLLLVAGATRLRESRATRIATRLPGIRATLLVALVVSLLATGSAAAADKQKAGDKDAPDYAEHIAPIFKKYCNGCHNAIAEEGKLNLESFAALMKGGENGKVLVPGQPEKSRLILQVTRQAEPFMPPKGNKGPTDEEIALLKAWVEAGAHGPDGERSDPLKIVTPDIKPAGEPREPVNDLAYSPDGRWLAVARYGRVEILSGENQKPVRTLSGHSGHVNDVVFSEDGKLLAVAAGEPSLYGELTLWNTQTWKKRRTIKGHNDSLYAVAVSPDGKRIATGSYDQAIKVWDVETGEELRAMTGHNGAVFDLAFHPDGKLLASASGDETVKLWDATTGKRLETLNQPTEAQHTLAFTPDGRQLAAAGVDNRIRVWRIDAKDRSGESPLLYSRFAHEAPLINLVFSPNGKVLVSSAENGTVKLWETERYTQLRVLEQQPDWAAGLAVVPDGQTLITGRLDGSISTYPLQSGDATAGTAAEPVTDVDFPVKPVDFSEPVTETEETEPNDEPAAANMVSLPCKVTGVLDPQEGRSEDVDLFLFDATAGDQWIIETNAARQGSPADTKVEVLHPDGSPVLRYKLQAVLDSYITFRPIDSSQNKVRVKNWQEMELNQYMYMAGEVCKLFRMPQGPDSGFLFYTNRGKRRCYFDTSGTIHAKEDPVYIVRAYPPEAELVDNGLPVFPLHYVNDDDGERELGNDSRLTFTAPESDLYALRVSDVRGFGGKDYKYTLTVRRPKPGFRANVDAKDAKLAPGSGQRFTVRLDRIDNFSGPVTLEIENMPEGFTATTPISVEAGHLEARGVINAAPDAEAPGKEAWSQVTITATAEVAGEPVTQQVGNFGEIQLAEPPKVYVKLETDPSGQSPDGPDDELVVAPGETITAMIRVKRNGYDGELKFDVDNLPHGVIVDNIGLNGILVRKNENRRRIFLTAADWVPETTRAIHAVTKGRGKQASRPLLLHVRKPETVAEADNR